jgi:hypothetical protein
MPMKFLRLGVVSGLCGLVGCRAAAPAPSPETVAAELWAADSTFGAGAGATDAVTSLSAMFAADVVMPAPGGRFVEGAAATEALRSNPDNAVGTARWAPVRVGIAADGVHGFTFGYGTLTRTDLGQTRWKYLSYWIKGPSGWRVAAFKRGPRPDSGGPSASQPPVVPAAWVPAADSATVEQFRASLAQAERSFSDEAQRIGLGPAFVKWGRPDAVNMGGPTTAEFLLGAEAIGANIGAGSPDPTSPVSWAPDHRVIVASSGDLGVTFGLIRPNQPPPSGAPPGFAFFTIWYRQGPADPWRYIAE